MNRKAGVHRFEARHPADTSGLAGALAAGRVDANDIVCIIGKTEGNGGANDFSRDLAVRAFSRLLAQAWGSDEADVEERVMLSFSGGTEGVVCPHYVVVTRTAGPQAPEGTAGRGLAIARGRTGPLTGDAVQTMAETARVVRGLMAALSVMPPDVHLVHIKGALAGATDVSGAAGARARGASALGVALALEEVPAEVCGEEALARGELFSGVAHVSVKPGMDYNDIVLFANAPGWAGPWRIGHTVMRDIIDIDSVRRLLAGLGLPDTGSCDGRRIGAVFAKSDADPSHRIRGRRHTMWTDGDVSDMRYSRCVVAALLAGLTGETAVHVSTRAEHMGPPGGGPVAVIVADA